MPTIYEWISHYGYLGLFLLLVLGIVGLPVPDETLLTYVGYLVFRGRMRFIPTVAAAFLGSVGGISLSYGLGRTLGHQVILRYGRFLHITPSRLEVVHGWFARAGRWTLTFGYFVPGVRHLTALVAGSSNLELPVFTLYAYTGGMIWVLTFILGGYWLGEQWLNISAFADRHAISAVSVVLVVALAYIFLVRRHRPKG